MEEEKPYQNLNLVDIQKRNQLKCPPSNLTFVDSIQNIQSAIIESNIKIGEASPNNEKNTMIDTQSVERILKPILVNQKIVNQQMAKLQHQHPKNQSIETDKKLYSKESNLAPSKNMCKNLRYESFYKATKQIMQDKRDQQYLFNTLKELQKYKSGLILVMLFKSVNQREILSDIINQQLHYTMQQNYLKKVVNEEGQKTINKLLQLKKMHTNYTELESIAISEIEKIKIGTFQQEQSLLLKNFPSLNNSIASLDQFVRERISQAKELSEQKQKYLSQVNSVPSPTEDKGAKFQCKENQFAQNKQKIAQNEDILFNKQSEMKMANQSLAKGKIQVLESSNILLNRRVEDAEAKYLQIKELLKDKQSQLIVFKERFNDLSVKINNSLAGELSKTQKSSQQSLNTLLEQRQETIKKLTQQAVKLNEMKQKLPFTPFKILQQLSGLRKQNQQLRDENQQFYDQKYSNDKKFKEKLTKLQEKNLQLQAQKCCLSQQLSKIKIESSSDEKDTIQKSKLDVVVQNQVIVNNKLLEKTEQCEHEPQKDQKFQTPRSEGDKLNVTPDNYVQIIAKKQKTQDKLQATIKQLKHQRYDSENKLKQFQQELQDANRKIEDLNREKEARLANTQMYKARIQEKGTICRIVEERKRQSSNMQLERQQSLISKRVEISQTLTEEVPNTPY